jgi:hypothetical protein
MSALDGQTVVVIGGSAGIRLTSRLTSSRSISSIGE